MEISNVAKSAVSIADTGTKQEIGVAVLKKALQVEASTATALINAVQPAQPAKLPPHLGNKINTTA